jgi:hypothetical protein
LWLLQNICDAKFATLDTRDRLGGSVPAVAAARLAQIPEGAPD